MIGKECEIGDNVKIENGAVIGNNVKINHGAIIGHSCVIGDETKVGSNSTISNSILGENIYIGSNTSIGQRGFGFYLNNKKNYNIYHSGRVVIQSNVSIGSGCTLTEAVSMIPLLVKTRLDNQCHVAITLKLEVTVHLPTTGIAGSTKIGNNVLTGGQAGIAGHITVGNNVRIAAKSGVFQNLNDNESVMGNPAVNLYKFIKNYKKIYGKK